MKISKLRLKNIKCFEDTRDFHLRMKKAVLKTGLLSWEITGRGKQRFLEV